MSAEETSPKPKAPVAANRVHPAHVILRPSVLASVAVGAVAHQFGAPTAALFISQKEGRRSTVPAGVPHPVFRKNLPHPLLRKESAKPAEKGIVLQHRRLPYLRHLHKVGRQWRWRRPPRGWCGHLAPCLKPLCRREVILAFHFPVAAPAHLRVQSPAAGIVNVGFEGAVVALRADGHHLAK